PSVSQSPSASRHSLKPLQPSYSDRTSDVSEAQVLGALLDGPLLEEALRLRRLQSFKVLDTEPESAFQRLAEFAAELCNCPMAMISFVDQQRVWLKAEVG